MKKTFLIVVIMIIVAMTACSSDTAEKNGLPETIVLDPAGSNSIRIFWEITDVYTAVPEKDPELYEYILEKFPMTFSYVKMYPTDVDSGERHGMSFLSGEEEILKFKLYDGTHIVYKGGVYKADDPDWSFTREELTELMEPYRQKG